MPDNKPSYNRSLDFLQGGPINIPPQVTKTNPFGLPEPTTQNPVNPKDLFDSVFGQKETNLVSDYPFLKSEEFTTPIRFPEKDSLRYQDPVLGYDPFNPNLEYMYGDKQSGWEKWGHNLTKFGANLLGGVVETVAALPETISALAQGDISKAYDNGVTNSISEWLDNLENKMPNYRTTFEESHPVLSYIPGFASIKTLGDSWGGVLKNVGFMAGAIAGSLLEDAVLASATEGIGEAPLIVPQINRVFGRFGKVFSSAKSSEEVASELSGLFNAGRTTTLTESSTRAKDLVESINKASKARSIVDRSRYVTSLMNSSLGLSTVLANQTFNSIKQQLTDKFRKDNGRDPDRGEISQIEEYAKGGGNADLYANMALTLFTEGTMLKSVFMPTSLARAAASKQAVRGLPIDLVEGSRDVFAQVQKSANAFNLIKDKIISPVTDMALGGIQFGGQMVIGRTAEDYYKRKFDDPYATNNFMLSVGTAFRDTFNTRDGLENLFSGILAGGVLHAGKRLYEKAAGIDSHRQRLIDSSLAWLNSERLTGLFDTTYNEAVTADSIAKDMKRAMNTGDIFEYKNLKFQQLFNFVDSGIKSNRFDLRIDQLKDLKELPQSEFEKMFQLPFNDENRRLVNDYVDSVINKAFDIKANVDKVDQLFPNPYNFRSSDPNEIQNYRGFEDYKTMLKLDLAELKDNRARLQALEGDISKRAPLLDRDKLTKLTSEQGIQETIDGLNTRLENIQTSLDLIEDKKSDEYKKYVAEKKFVESKVTELNKALDEYDPVAFHKTAEDLINYWVNNGTEFKNRIDPIDVNTLLHQGQDMFKLINATDRALYHYQKLVSQKGFDDYISTVKEAQAKAAENFEKSETGQRLLAPSKPTEPKTDDTLYQSLSSKAQGGDKTTIEAGTPEEGLTYLKDKAAEDPVAFEERFGASDTKQLIDKIPTEILQANRDKLAAVNADQPSVGYLDDVLKERKEVPTEIKPEPKTEIKPSPKEEDILSLPGQAEEVILPFERSDNQPTVEKEQKQSEERTGKTSSLYQNFAPINNFNKVYSANFEDGAKNLDNLRDVLFSNSPQQLYDKLTINVSESTEGKKGGEFKLFKPFNNIHYQGYKLDIELVADGKVIGLIRPFDTLAFKRGDEYLPLDQLRPDEYEKVTRNNPETYEDFMNEVRAYKDIVSKIEADYAKGKRSHTNEEVKALLDVKPDYGTVKYSSDASTSTSIGSLRYKTDGDAIISIPDVFNRSERTYERTYEPNVLNKDNLSEEDYGKLQKFLSDNIEKLRSLNKRYFYVFKMPDGEYRSNSAVIARPSEASPEVLAGIMQLIKAVEPTTGDPIVEAINGRLRNELYIADKSGKKTKFGLEFKLRKLMLNVENAAKRFKKSYEIDTKNVNTVDDLVEAINSTLLRHSDDDKLYSVATSIRKEDLKASILPKEETSMEALSKKLKVSAYPNPFKDFRLFVMPKKEGTPVTVAKEEPTKVSPLQVQLTDKKSTQKAMKDIFGLPTDQATAVSEIYDRVAKSWAERTGKPVGDFYKNILIRKGAETDIKGDFLPQLNNLLFQQDKFKTPIQQKLGAVSIEEFIGNLREFLKKERPKGWGYSTRFLESIVSEWDKLDPEEMQLTREEWADSEMVRDVVGHLLTTREGGPFIKNLFGFTDAEANVLGAEYMEHEGYTPAQVAFSGDFLQPYNTLNVISKIHPRTLKEFADKQARERGGGPLINRYYDEELGRVMTFYRGTSFGERLFDSFPDFRKAIALGISNRYLTRESRLNQDIRAAVLMAEDGKATIMALSDPNVSSPLHELAHIWERQLLPEETKAVLDWAGHEEWSRQTSEKFARGFEKYLSEGKAPSTGLKKIFENFKKWLYDIYQGIVGSDIDLTLNDDMRKVYTQMLGEKFKDTVKKEVKKEEPTRTTPTEITDLKKNVYGILTKGKEKTLRGIIARYESGERWPQAEARASMALKEYPNLDASHPDMFKSLTKILEDFKKPEPKTFYRGTYEGSSVKDVTYFSSDEGFAKRQANQYLKGVFGKYNIDTKNIFDYENSSDLKKLKDYSEELYKELTSDKKIMIGGDIKIDENNNWRHIESPDFQKFLKDRGYEGFYTKEHGVKNLGIYDFKLAKEIKEEVKPVQPVSSAKETWQIPIPAGSDTYWGHKSDIQRAILEHRYDDAIRKGEMTEQELRDIIASTKSKEDSGISEGIVDDIMFRVGSQDLINNVEYWKDIPKDVEQKGYTNWFKTIKEVVRNGQFSEAIKKEILSPAEAQGILDASKVSSKLAQDAIASKIKEVEKQDEQLEASEKEAKNEPVMIPESTPEVPVLEYEQGEEVLYKGKPYKIDSVDTQASGNKLYVITDGTRYGTKPVYPEQLQKVKRQKVTEKEVLQDVQGKTYRDLESERGKEGELTEQDHKVLNYVGLKTLMERLKDKFGIPYKIVETDAEWKGRFKDGEVSININKYDNTTPFHEYLHPFIAVMKVENPDLYKNLAQELGKNKYGQDIIKELRGNKEYKDSTPEELGDEALVRYISKAASENITSEGRRVRNKYYQAMKRLLDQFRDWFRGVLKNIVWREGKQEAKIGGIPEEASLQDVADLVSLHDMRFDMRAQSDLLGAMESYQADVDTLSQERVIMKTLKSRLATLQDMARKRIPSDELLNHYITVKNLYNNAEEAGSLDRYLLAGIRGLRYAADEFKRITQAVKSPEQPLTPEDIRDLSHGMGVVKNLIAFYKEDVDYLVKGAAKRMDEEDHYDYLKVLADADRTIGRIHARSIDILTEWLYPYIEKTNPKEGKYPEFFVTKEDFRKQLWTANQDVSAVASWMDGISMSKDPLNSIAFIVFKHLYEDVYRDTHQMKADTNLSYFNFLKEKGLKNDKKATEEHYKKNYLRKATIWDKVDEDTEGKPIYDSKQHWAFHEEFYHDLWEKDLSDYLDSIKFDPTNEKHMELYQDWLKNNTQTITNKFGFNTAVPSEKYRNPEFEKLYGKDKFFTQLYDSYVKSNETLGDGERLKFGIVPQVSKGKNLFADYKGNTPVEAVKTFGGKVLDFLLPQDRTQKIVDQRLAELEREKQTKLAAIDEVGLTPDEYNKRVQEVEDLYSDKAKAAGISDNIQKNLDGSYYRNIRAPHVRLLDESDLNLTLPETVSTFYEDVERTSRLRDLEPNVAILKSITEPGSKYIKEVRSAIKRTSKGNIIWSDHLPSVKHDASIRLNKQLNGFIDKVMYGLHDDKQVWNLLNLRQIDMNRLGKNWATLTSIETLGLNITAPISTGGIQDIISLSEAFGNKYLGPKDWLWAKMEYSKNIPEFLADLSKPNKSFYTQLAIKYDAIHGEFRDKWGKKIVGNMAQRYANSGALFAFMHGAFHENQVSFMMGLMKRTPVKTKDGKTINLIEAHVQDKNGNLKLRDDVIWNPDDERNFTTRLHGLNEYSFGLYNSFNQSMLMRKWYGKLALMFRKHYYTQLKARYGSSYYDRQIQDRISGIHNDFFRKLASDIRTYKMEGISRAFTQKGWSEDEAYAARRTTFELGLFAAMAIMCTAIARGESEDKDKNRGWGEQYLKLLAFRLRGDLAQLNPLVATQIYDIAKNPTVIMGTLGKFGSFFEQMATDPFATYKKKTGAFDAGESVLYAKLAKLIPGYNQWIKMKSPDEQRKFYTVFSKNY